MATTGTLACIFATILFCVLQMIDATKRLEYIEIGYFSQDSTHQRNESFKHIGLACNQHLKFIRDVILKKQETVHLKPEDELRNKRIIALCALISSDVDTKKDSMLDFQEGKPHKNFFSPWSHYLKASRKKWAIVTGVQPKFMSLPLKSENIVNPLSNTSYKARSKRSAEKLLHKLIRILPAQNVTEKPFLKDNSTIDIKLNTSSFAVPHKDEELPIQSVENATLSYEQIEDLAFADLNGTKFELYDNLEDEQLPNPEELVSGPRYRVYNKHRPNLLKADIKRRRIPIRSHQQTSLQKKCERFTASMCIKADDYPMELIMGSIRRHKNAMSALLAEYHDKAAELEYQEQLEEYQFNSKRREDGVVTPGGMCASIVRYARPQKARSASGEWKYIVNTGRHTQTLRLEKCSTPQESCSYLSHNYRSRCTQVYNYHRLLSWDKSRGLHVDIFKVPTCCSCQVDGYRETFPPLGASKHKDFKDFKDFTSVQNNSPYITVNDEFDYEDENDDDDSLPYRFASGLKKNKHSELLLGSRNVKTKINPPRYSPTVGSYLSPPSDDYDTQTVVKSIRPTFGGKIRKPYSNFVPSESRADLEISGTEQSDKEIRPYSINEHASSQQKNTRDNSESTNIDTAYQPGPITSVSNQSNVPTLVRTTLSSARTNSSPPMRKELGNGKRVNYNYHPIIDFFENHQKVSKGQSLGRRSATNNIPVTSEVITSRDQRISHSLSPVENSWHPLVVNR